MKKIARQTQGRFGQRLAGHEGARKSRRHFAQGKAAVEAVGGFGEVAAGVLGLSDRVIYAAGWLMSRKDPIHPASSFDYDPVGNRIRSSDAAGYGTVFEYDALSRLVKTIDAKQGESTTVYNADGLITSRTDQSGQTTTMQYDVRGRLWKVTDGASNVTETIYGSAENALNGLVAAMQYPSYREEYKYDPRGRRTQTIRILSESRRETTTSGFDANGNSNSSTDALGRSTLYAYDKLNRLTETTDALGGKTQLTDHQLSMSKATSISRARVNHCEFTRGIGS